MTVHVAVERAQRGVFLPRVARHLLQHRSLEVHHFIVRERQHEVLGERVHQGERNPTVVTPAIDRILSDVVEHVVHPAHVPLEAEPEPPR